MNAINQAQFVDPVQVLPKENLLQIFSYLCQDEVDSSSKVNHDWRDSIQSDFSLFTSIEVKSTDEFFTRGAMFAPWWDEEKAKLEGMRTTIGTLSRLARLSNNRLKQVYIGLAAFGGYMPRSTGGWRFSRLSLVFDTLTLSSNTLTRLQLDFPQMIPNITPIEACRDYITTILAKLSSFPQLKEIELKALPLFELISKSQNKTMTLSSHPLGVEPVEHFEYKCDTNIGSNMCAFDVSEYLLLSEIIHEINAFTGGSLSRLASTIGDSWKEASPWLFPETTEELQASTETLEKLEGSTGNSGATLLEITGIVTRCPQLTSLKLYCDFNSLGPLVPLDEDWIITFPLEAVQESKLKTLMIRIDEGPGKIVINDPMIKWVGSSLETLSLRRGVPGWDEEEDREDALVPLLNLIQNCRFSLHSIEILSFFYSNLPVQLVPRSTIVLTAVKNLNLEGNAELINGFTSFFRFPFLTHLKLDKSSWQEERVKIDQVIDFVRSTSSSLETLTLSTKGPHETPLETDSEDNSQNPMDFPRLVEFRFSFSGAADIGPFSRSRLPKLVKLVKLYGASGSHGDLFYSNAPLLAEAEAEEERREKEEEERRKKKGKRTQRT